MSDNRDPGDEHRDPWPFYAGDVFEVRGDDEVRAFIHGAWHLATAVVDRSKAQTYIAHADGSVEAISIIRFAEPEAE